MIKIKPFCLKSKLSLPSQFSFSFFDSKEKYPFLQYYKEKRIYKDKKKGELLNGILINELCQHELFVKNSMGMYNLSKFLLGIFIF